MRGRIFFILCFILAVSIFVTFYYFSDRGITGNVIDEGKGYKVYKINFTGADSRIIYGLFFVPDRKKFDSVIVLPGGGGTKESRKHYGDFLVREGYGVLILDQRGIGETGGEVPKLGDEIYAVAMGEDAFQITMAKDVIKAVDFLKKYKNIEEIAVIGESMGGRVAIIAAGLEKRIKGIVVISSAGYSGSTGNEFTDVYLKRINPNSYIPMISPRRVLMLHAKNDSVIPIEDAKRTFNLAKEPKKFVEIDKEGCIHGYCNEMKEHIIEELVEMFS